MTALAPSVPHAYAPVPQAIRPPAPHAAAPLEPRAQLWVGPAQSPTAFLDDAALVAAQ